MIVDILMQSIDALKWSDDALMTVLVATNQ
jgi:hypothetical protein